MDSWGLDRLPDKKRNIKKRERGFFVYFPRSRIAPSVKILVGTFLRGQEGKGAHAFEVTRDKKVVWKYDDHKLV